MFKWLNGRAEDFSKCRHFLWMSHPGWETSRQNVVSETSAASCWGASLQDAVSSKPPFASAPLRHKGTYFSLIFLSFSTRQATRPRTQRSKKKKKKQVSRLVLGEGRLSANAQGNFSGDALAPSNKNSESAAFAKLRHLVTLSQISGG